MSEYLVRWKFAANSLINHLDVETNWYLQFHSTKKAAVDHYVSYLTNSPPSYEMTIEILQLTKLVPGEPESEDVVDEIGDRNKQVIKLFGDGLSRKEIAELLEIKYHVVCKILRRQLA